MDYKTQPSVKSLQIYLLTNGCLEGRSNTLNNAEHFLCPINGLEHHLQLTLEAVVLIIIIAVVIINFVIYKDSIF